MSNAAQNLEDTFRQWTEACQVVSTPYPKKDELHVEARTFFRALFDGTSAILHEGVLAKLIKTLGPALTGNFAPRICALEVLCGALEGFHSIKLTLKVANLVSAFLLEQCSPIEAEDNNDNGMEEDNEEQIRDAALVGLAALAQCQLNVDNDPEKLVEAIHLCLKVAQEGVERRCAVTDDEDDDMQHGFMNARRNDIRSSLSTLPRSKRSRCFSLLHASADGITSLLQTNPDISIPSIGPKVQTEIVTFVSFVTLCLQGESDPRCLMQLLNLFHHIQVTFEPILVKASLPTFPTTEVFDAVAPYYPVQFTPPPNDPHGITEDILRKALMSVLGHFGYDKLAAKHNRDTMISLSLGIVLERLVIMDGDGSTLATSAFEKLDAMDDLKTVLFLTSNSSLELLDVASVQQLSKALIVVHEEASLAVAHGSGDAVDNRQLADICRGVISDVAYRLEASSNKQFWKIFVQDSIKSMSTMLTTSSTRGSTAIAYLACLAASGGPQTLRCCLEAGLAPLVNVFKSGMEDEESVTAAAYGIGAFYSSARVSIDKATKDGLVLHPHPLKTFGSTAFQALYEKFCSVCASTTARMACARALESVLLVCPASLFGDVEVANAGRFALSLTKIILESIKSSGDGEADGVKWLNACGRILGALIGSGLAISDDGMEEESSTVAPCVLESEAVHTVLRNDIFPDLVNSSRQQTKNSKAPRADRTALAIGCTFKFPATKIIVKTLMGNLRDSLRARSHESSPLECGNALFTVLRDGGLLSAKAFHDTSDQEVTATDVIDALCSFDPRPRVCQKENDKASKLHNLDLPTTAEEWETGRELTLVIVSQLKPAYELWVPYDAMLQLLSLVSKVLPPLSDQDAFRMSILLPLLAASLKNFGASVSEESEVVLKTLTEQLNSYSNDLSTYVLSFDYDARSRAAAAACVYAIILEYSDQITQECPVQRLLEKLAIPSLQLALDSFPDTVGEPTSAAETQPAAAFADCLNMTALLGSVAARRGGISSSTADKISSFLIELACARRAHVPFAAEGSAQIDLLAYDNGNVTRAFLFPISAASAFGSILSVEDGRPLWKQRLTHNAMKFLAPIIEERGTNVSVPASAIVGCLAVACHVICSSTIKSISVTNRELLARFVVKNLVSGPLYDEGHLTVPLASDLTRLKKLVLASTLKLSCEIPNTLSSFTDSIVTGVMRCYAVGHSADPLSEVSCKLLALQVLERIGQIELSRKALMALKPCVTSILSAAMNHPSRMLRHAAVSVRNTWSAIEV